jgi:hypothetical protein
MNWLDDFTNKEHATRLLVAELVDVFRERNVRITRLETWLFAAYPISGLPLDHPAIVAVDEWRERLEPEVFDTVDPVRIVYWAMQERVIEQETGRTASI